MTPVPVTFPLVMTPLALGYLLMAMYSRALLDVLVGLVMLVGPWLIVVLSRRWS